MQGKTNRADYFHVEKLIDTGGVWGGCPGGMGSHSPRPGAVDEGCSQHGGAATGRSGERAGWRPGDSDRRINNAALDVKSVCGEHSEERLGGVSTCGSLRFILLVLKWQ